MSDFATILEIIRPACSQREPLEIENSFPKGVVISSEDIVAVSKALHTHPSCYFDMLNCITGIDNGPEKGTMEVIYNLTSIPYNLQFMLKVIVSRENPEVESLCSIWKSANWMEREVFDMFGIKFKNHPDLRRILMPADWEGFPLRKDYQHQEYYRGVKVSTD